MVARSFAIASSVVVGVIGGLLMARSYQAIFAYMPRSAESGVAVGLGVSAVMFVMGSILLIVGLVGVLVATLSGRRTREQP